MIPVVFVSYHQPEIASRGYWDAGVLERVFDRTLWRVPGGHSFSCYSGFAGDETGAVVVVPAQHHTNQADVDRLNRDIARLKWCVLILTGDECSLFPWHQIHHPRMRLWVMTPRPGAHAELATRGNRFVPNRFLGEGWKYDTPDILWGVDETAPRAGWFFAGQVTHRRRKQCVAALKASPYPGDLVETAGFTKGLPRDVYLQRMAAARVVPSPAGPGTPDSFRLYEALEAGCIPLADAVTPEGWEGYWPFLLGEHPPFPVIDSWPAQLDDTLTDIDVGWPANANRISAWWQLRKRSLAYGINHDIAVMAGPAARADPSDDITVLMPTSPTPNNPDTSVIEQTISSIRAQPDLADAEIIVMIDGVRAEQEDRRAAYEEYTRRLLQLTNRWHNVVPMLADEHLHQANLTRAALKLVTTPLILFVEHDTPLVHPSEGTIPWGELGDVMLRRSLGVVRFHHESEVLPAHMHLMPDKAPRVIDGVPLQRCAQWSQRPHLAQTQMYRWMVDTYFGRESRTMLEDVMHGVVDQAWREQGDEGWAQFRVFMYAPPGNIRRSYHLDGRGADEKFGMTFSYPDDNNPPAGAPYPTSRRVD